MMIYLKTNQPKLSFGPKEKHEKFGTDSCKWQGHISAVEDIGSSEAHTKTKFHLVPASM
jgi:hypothetical protein